MRRHIIYAKLSLLTLLAIYIASFVIVNSMQDADVWFFLGITKKLSVIWIIAITAIATFLMTWFFRQFIASFKQLRQVMADTGQTDVKNDTKNDSENPD